MESKRPGTQTRKSFESPFEIHEIKTACTIINTADYCQTTALELEENIKAKCDPVFKDKITLQDEQDLFVGFVEQ